jgi:hypothetical protein
MQEQGQNQVQRFMERETERDEDRILGKKILIFMAIMAWMVAMFASYLDGGAGANGVIRIIAGVYNFMISYMSFSQKVICDMVSFIIGLVFIVVFSLSSVIIIILLSIPFLACIFAFTDI